MKTHSIILVLVGLLLAACSSPILAQPGLDTAGSTIPLTPTTLPLRSTPQSTSNIQPAHSVDFLELGMRITLPPDWNFVNQPGVVLAGPGLTAENSMERTWLHLSLNADVPQTLPELTKVVIDGMRTVGHINQLTTTRIVVGASRDPSQPEHWVSIYVPTNGLVHEIVFHPILLSTDGKQLTSVGQAILDSTQFLPAARSSSISPATSACPVFTHDA